MPSTKHLKPYQFKNKTGRSQPCNKRLVVMVTEDLIASLNSMGKNKAEFVRQAIEEKLAREEGSALFKKINEDADDFRYKNAKKGKPSE